MSEITMSLMVRALQASTGDLDCIEQSLIADAYASSAAGSKIWHLTPKQREHVFVIFHRYYDEH